jgi:hypothetical protein
MKQGFRHAGMDGIRIAYGFFFSMHNYFVWYKMSFLQKRRGGNDFFISLHLFNARMAELVDALVSGTSVGNDVQVRVLFRVRITNK